MADIIYVREDVLRRPLEVEYYPEGASLPSHVERLLERGKLRRERQVVDEREEVKTTQRETARRVGDSYWYDLPDGRRVNGKTTVLNEGYALPDE